MSQYILRLDDASDYMDVKKWQRMEELLDRHGIKPLVGIIPDNTIGIHFLLRLMNEALNSGIRLYAGKKKAGSWHFMVAITSIRQRKEASTR